MKCILYYKVLIFAAYYKGLTVETESGKKRKVAFILKVFHLEKIAYYSPKYQLEESVKWLVIGV